MLLVFAMEGFPYHLASDKGKQAKGYPMVDGVQALAEMGCTQLAYQRHGSLKHTEEKGHAQNRHGKIAAEDYSTHHAHRETVHSQSGRQQQ